MDKKTPNQEIRRLVKKIETALHPVILFGSRATADFWKRSDYDFIIVSSKFDGMHWLDRISMVVKLWDSLSEIDALPYTPKEFEEKSKISSVVKHAIKHGKRIAG